MKFFSANTCGVKVAHFEIYLPKKRVFSDYVLARLTEQ